MSYLVLDRTKINYISPKTTRGGIILSQVVESEMGPETPVLVSSTSELDIYFGRSFEEREYYEELLSGDVTLLLTTPFKPENIELPVINTSEYKVVSTVLSEGIEVSLQYSDQLPEVGEKETKYYVSSEDEYYIYEGEWIKVSEVPTEITPGATSNRDTLRLVSKGWGEDNGVTWCWPKYSTRDWTPEYSEILSKETTESLLGSLKDRKPSDPEKYIGFTLDFSGVKGVIEGEFYLVIPTPSDRNLQFYFGSPLGPDVLMSKNIKVEGQDLGDQINFIIKELGDTGWICTPADDSKLVWDIYNKDLFTDLEFYNIPGLKFYGNAIKTHNILSILSEDHKRLEFFSKTLGKGDEDIKVEISEVKGKTEWYRVVISRYDVQEIYEGPLYLEVDEETNIFTSIEKTINRNSSLVSVRVYDSFVSSSVKHRYSKSNPSHGLPTGTFTLSRALPQSSWTPEDYWRGLERLEEFNVSEDFMMIPRVENYLKTGVKIGESWYSEYKDLLSYASSKNCQILISNHPYLFGCITHDDFESPTIERPDFPMKKHLYLIGGTSAEIWDGEKWTVISKEGSDRWYEIQETLSDNYTGNQIFNLLDPDNRLVYFYQDMTYRGWSRPAWYIFLRGILSGVYSMTTDDIIYSSPAEYYTEEERPGKNLEDCKSNFLSDNGHIYYYRKFFSQPDDTNTILARFCLDKVSNTVSRDFPAYLSKETTGEILTGLRGILSGLKSRYPIIYSLSLDHIEEDPYDQKLSVYLSLGIREMLDKDVKLSVTLNFNFT